MQASLTHTHTHVYIYTHTHTDFLTYEAYLFDVGSSSEMSTTRGGMEISALHMYTYEPLLRVL